jgi:hypothetical protein
MVVPGKFSDYRPPNETRTASHQNAHVLILPLRLVPGLPEPSQESYSP